jgi:hypothetical protein
VTSAESVQAWTGTSAPAQERVPEVVVGPLRGRQKKTKPGKPAKASRVRAGRETPDDGGGGGAGRADLYVQAKARPVGVFVAWTCVGLIALGSGLGAIGFLTPKAEATVQQSVLSPQQQKAGADAVGFVSAWLSATTNDSDALNRYLGTNSAGVVSRSPVEARNITAASIETATNGSIVVTVAGEVKTTAPAGQGTPTPTASAGAGGVVGSVWVQRWWSVAMSEQAGGYAVLGLPSPVPGPGHGSAPSLAYVNAASPEATKAVSDFLAAYATGVGDVSRYVSPGSGIGAIVPAPYSTVKVRSVNTVNEVPAGVPKDRAQVRALVVVDLVVGDGQQQESQYALTLTARGGQWEVSAVEPVPVLVQKK